MMNRGSGLLRIACFFFMALLLGCNSTTYNQTEGNIADAKLREVAARAHMDAITKTPSPLVIKDGLYVDTTPVSLERQPDWLKNPIVIKGDQLPFSYYTHVISGAADNNVLSKYQSGLDPSTPVSINYSGTVKGALDILAAKTGFVYSIQRGNSIYWQAYITRTYSVAFMPGTSDYMLGQTSGTNTPTPTSGGATDTAASEYSGFSGKSLSIWADVQNTVKQLLSTEGKVFVSQSSTSVTVRDKPSNVDLVGQYVRNLNKSLSQQVYVKVEVLDVSLQNDYNFGINWQAVERAFAHSNFVFNANYGSPLSITPLTGLPIPNGGLAPGTATAALANAGATTVLQALIDALNQQAKVSIVAQPRIVCMNNQVSAIRIINSQQYIQSVSNTSVPSTGSASGSQTVNNVSTITSQITPATLVTGFTMYVLPKILGEKVYLQINVDMSENSSITQLCAQAGTSTTTCAANSYVIQSPHVTEKVFNQRSVLVTGETLILSGLKQVTNKTGAMQLFNLQDLGGKASTQTNNDTVILVTPYILHPVGSG